MVSSASEEEVIFSDEGKGFEENEIHVRKQNRKGRKWLTTVENIPESCDMGDLLVTLKKELCCNGSITDNPANSGKVLQMQGDHGFKMKSRLQTLFPEYKVVFHGN
ncbi:translation initiation factor 1 [Nematocida displodere]|uniref:Translation initiation factor 1 n=1 Tax=Nematocida displodere TaxID=1805483 RepID=A0A177EBS2_9MICR|nr:translation initiation factor 1 [Nematocida displodere]